MRYLIPLLLLIGCQTDSGIGFSPTADVTYLEFGGEEGGAVSVGVIVTPPYTPPFPAGLDAERVAARDDALRLEAETANERADAWSAWAAYLEAEPAQADNPGADTADRAGAGGDGGPALDLAAAEAPEPAAEPAAGLPSPETETPSDPFNLFRWDKALDRILTAIITIAGVLGTQRGRKFVKERRANGNGAQST